MSTQYSIGLMPVSAPRKCADDTHEFVVCRVPIGTKAMLEDYRRVNGYRSKNEALNDIIHAAVLDQFAI